jgi:cellulose synthase/poly-beta-1,6-N-acetylglucosamine synthase-like glycosyltransferase
VTVITLLAALRMLFTLALAHIHVRRMRRRPAQPSYTPPVSIIVPAYNEAACIERTITSLSSSRYPAPFEVVVVDDGSSDRTGDLVAALRLAPVRLVSQANAGKAAALNRGVAAARHNVIVTVDGDTQFEPDTLPRLVQRLREPGVGAVSGNAKVGNRSGLIGRWQHIEYVMGFNLDRRMYEVLGCTPTVPGAIGAFHRQAVVDAGGFSGVTLAEDTDIALQLGRAGWKVVYAEDARAWTEAPTTVRDLFRQRRRWAYGVLQSTWKHRYAAGHRRERAIGLLAIPYITVFQILLPLAAPLIDLFAIYGILFLDPLPILGFWLAFNGLQAVLAWSAFGFDGESRRVLWALPLQQVVYRQLMYLVVMDAVVSALLGSRLGWNRVARTGEAKIPGQDSADGLLQDQRPRELAAASDVR